MPQRLAPKRVACDDRIRNSMASARILPEPPTSGLFEELHFGSDGAERWLWVEFEDNGELWVGSFRSGFHGRSGVHTFNDGVAFIAAGGHAYWINIKTRAALSEFGEEISAFVAFTDRTAIAAVYSVYVLVLTPAREEWRSGRVAVDDMRLLDARGDRIDGDVENLDGKWHHFSIDLLTHEVSGGIPLDQRWW